VSVLPDFGHERVSRDGSHLKMCYESPDTDGARVVPIPLNSEVERPTGTLHSVADQCDAGGVRA
jgi:predicted RNA binding protein YcfA (HicA-like mRNA interferase family)